MSKELVTNNMRQAIYKLDKPVEYYGGETSYVVSSHSLPFVEPETMIFPCTKDGEVLDWGELAVYVGFVDHDDAVGETFGENSFTFIKERA